MVTMKVQPMGAPGPGRLAGGQPTLCGRQSTGHSKLQETEKRRTPQPVSEAGKGGDGKGKSHLGCAPEEDLRDRTPKQEGKLAPEATWGAWPAHHAGGVGG